MLEIGTARITRREGTSYNVWTCIMEPVHIWELHDEAGVAAFLHVRCSDLSVANIETRLDRRRQGLARHLWTTACAQMPLVHDTPAHRTSEGDLFARSVGGRSRS